MKVGDGPVGVAIVQNTCMAVLVAELRASCQQIPTLPERGLTAILGKNWLRPGESSLTRMGGLLQVAPLSSEKRNMMSVSLLSLTTSSVYTRYRRPRCGLIGLLSKAKPASASIDREFCAGMKSKPPTFVVVAATAAPKGLGPSPSAFVLTKIVAGPCPPVGFWQACTTAPLGPIATSPKLQPAVPGMVCNAPKPPILARPRPVTAAPRATI